MREEELKECLERLCRLYGPPGQEDAVAAYCQPLLQEHCDRVWRDEAGNLIGFIKGQSKHDADSVRIFAHMDEIALIIKRNEIIHRESILNAARLLEAFLLRDDRPFMQRYCPQCDEAGKE